MKYLIKNITIDIFLITSIWSILNNSIYKLFFGFSSTIYVLIKYM